MQDWRFKELLENHLDKITLECLFGMFPCFRELEKEYDLSKLEELEEKYKGNPNIVPQSMNGLRSIFRASGTFSMA